MKAEFSKKINISKFSAYAVLSIERERLDIKKYLSNPNNTNVNRYLQSIDVLNSRNELTSKGQRLIDQGTLFQEEEGKYAFWVTEDDPFLKSKIIYLRRDRYSSEDKNKEIKKNSNFHGEHNVIIKDKDGKQEVKTIELIEMMDYSSEIQKSELDLVWEFDIKTHQTFPVSTTYFFKGNLIDIDERGKKESLKDEIKDLNQYKFDYKLSLNEFRNIFIKNGMDWDEKLSRMKIEFSEQLHSEKEWESFEIEELELKQKDFGKGLFEKAILFQIPIMPKKESATQWRNYLLNQYLKRNYRTEEEFDSYVKELNQKEAFVLSSLESPKNTEYIQILKPQRYEKSDAYYHLTSTMDLNPFKKITKPYSSFSIKSKEEYSMREIFEKLHSPNKVIKKTIISDRYIGQKIQYLFAVLKVYFETLEKANATVFTIAEKSPKQITLPHSIKIQPMEKKNDTHDRVIVLQYTDNTNDIWKLTSGFDLLEFDKKTEIDPDKKSNTRACTFIKVREQDIENYIREEF